ncbi:acetyl-CoA synthetase-like protein [Byssothecium circinans]|uniref:Acetyl-CoA synthetase-like protein n=1 Tax=Byssothecium circinans TaxID=147558 RepID=A0A6A5TB17_9PLEO|nr:acetyl-CoA synthetase-like protein [Byssothecium circinans]
MLSDIHSRKRQYDVAISITLGIKHIDLAIHCAPSHCDDDQTHRIISLLRNTVISLAKSCRNSDKEDTVGASIVAISNEDLRDIWQWNSDSSGDDASSPHFDHDKPMSASQGRSATAKAINAGSSQLAAEFALCITGTAVKTWIAGTEDSSRLVPIGCTGELVLECSGADLDHAYNVKNIATSFVDNPSWLLDGGGSGFHGRHGRIYQTGLLAQYTSDGSLVFVGRKAAQKKLEGQPVDLDKLETRMCEVPQVRQAVCLIPTAGPYLGKLVGLFSLQTSPKRDHGSKKRRPQLVSENHATPVRECIQALEASMDNTFPAPMVPSVWIALEEIHVNTDSRLSRKVLEEWIGHVDAETCAGIASAGSICRRPITAAEKVICHACSLFLNIPESNVKLNRSFIANGGDSMSAMRVSPHCRTAGFAISVASLLKIETLIGVAASATVAEDVKVQVEEFEKPFCLSPVQQWFFNQLPPEKVDTVTDVENKLVERHQELDIAQGKVFAADLFTFGSGD